MPNEIPYFKYHLDPLKTGNAKKLNFNCACCHKSSQYAYIGPKYSLQVQEDFLCFACIKSGVAAQKFDLRFTWFHSDSNLIDSAEIEELEKRTPSYTGWQEAVWPTHCNQISQFQGDFTLEELLTHFDELKSDIKEALGIKKDEDILNIIQSSNRIRANNPAFYKFHCLVCSKTLLHVDYT